MTTFLFFICCVLAAAAELALFFMGANMKYPSKMKFAAVFVAMIAVAVGLWFAYKALPEPTGCANVFFILLEVALGFLLVVGLLQTRLVRIVIGIVVAILLCRGAYWLFAMGVADGSFLGSGIAAAIVIVAVILAFGAILQLKKKLAK